MDRRYLDQNLEIIAIIQVGQIKMITSEETRSVSCSEALHGTFHYKSSKKNVFWRNLLMNVTGGREYFQNEESLSKNEEETVPCI